MMTMILKRLDDIGTVFERAIPKKMLGLGKLIKVYKRKQKSSKSLIGKNVVIKSFCDEFYLMYSLNFFYVYF